MINFNEKEWLYRADVLKILGVSRNTLYLWIKDGKFPEGREIVKGSWKRWHVSTLASFLDVE